MAKTAAGKTDTNGDMNICVKGKVERGKGGAKWGTQGR